MKNCCLFIAIFNPHHLYVHFARNEYMTLNKILSNMSEDLNVVIVGASGGIGRVFVSQLAETPQIAKVFALSRSDAIFAQENVVSGRLDYEDEGSIEAAAALVKEHGGPDVVIVAGGLLHDECGFMPEKSLRDLNLESFQKSYVANAIGIGLVAKHFLPLMPRDRRSVFGALTGRVGSISDNGLGGWYAYRAAKAAAHMILKNAAIEIGRRNKEAVIVALHPGTVDTDLSKPFQGNVAEKKLFTPEYSAASLLEVMGGLSPEDSGKIFDYKGEEIAP